VAYNRAAVIGAQRADTNAARIAEAQRALNQLLALASAPDFKGSVSVTVNSKDGILAAPIAGFTQHEAGKPHSGA